MSNLAKLPVSLPNTKVPDDTDPVAIARTYADVFDNLHSKDFVPDAVWRDSYALTGTLRTFYGSKGVSAAWTETIVNAKPSTFKLNEASAHVTRLPNGSSWVDFGYSFETQGALPLICNLLVSVTPDASSGEWKIWVLKTVLIQIKGAPSADVYEPPAQQNGATGHKNLFDEVDQDPHQKGDKRLTYECVIVGGGQAGLNTAGRCAALGLDYLVIEKNEKVGDNWRKRYDSARLHTIREYSHMPFERTFGPEYPEFLGKDNIAKGYCSWVEKYKINISLQTLLLSGTWDKSSKKWTLQVRNDATGVEKTITCSFVVLAVGAGGQIPFIPDIPGRENFRGTVLHSEEYTSPKGFEGKHGVIVGTANTAHDVAEDMLEHNLASTTMVQRSKTYVLPVEWYMKMQVRTYNATFPTELADQLGTTHPNAVLRLISMGAMHVFARQDPERFERLEKAGFRVNVFGDPAYHLLERLGGHYMDVGCSKKIADGLIKIKSDAAISHYTENGLAFANGTEIPADLIVFATGFDLNLSNRVKEFFGDEVANCFGEFSSMNDEGEASGAYRFYHPGLACHGGAIGASRWYSRFLALHVKAASMGRPFEIYQNTPVPPQLQN